MKDLSGLKDLSELLGTIAGITGLVFSIWIFKRQEGQLGDLNKLVTSTGTILEKMEGKSYFRAVVNTFFFLRGDSQQRFICFFPGHYNRRPFPLVVAGDYYALHILQSLLGTDKLELEPVPVNHPLPNRRPSSGQASAIYLCTPQTNAKLASIAPVVNLPANQPSARFLDIDLPCWFGTLAGDGGAVKKVIWIRNVDPLESPSEAAHTKAALLDEYAPYVHQNNIHLDYAILLRLTSKDKIKHFVIAGIHQYGTWIAAEFIRRLTEEPNLGPKLSGTDRDFITVIEGSFNEAKFHVPNCKIHSVFCWFRTVDGWEQITQ